MKTSLFVLFVFAAGICTGWYGKGWFADDLPLSPPDIKPNIRDSVNDHFAKRSTPLQISGTTPSQPSDSNPTTFLSQGGSQLNEGNTLIVSSTTSSVIETLRKLLGARLYFESVLFYQEQKLQNHKAAPDLRHVLVDELNRLVEVSDNTNFSELVDSYLSIYYDDIEVLLLLADYNQANGSYLEAVDVFLLAKTYAYSDVDQHKVKTGLTTFVKTIDSLYTEQQDWWSLVNLYAHLQTSGLMTSTYQYRQAIAHLRSGDRAFAVEQFNHLLNDSLVGESAALALNRLTVGTETPEATVNSVWDGAESIRLQALGNQYLVNLSDSQQNSVQLLIDTGASMTALSTDAFNEINKNGNAAEVESRVFRTAGGVVKGMVYSVPELSLGPYLLKDTKIAVIDFERDREIDGLLGMNILGQFKFEIDQENSRLRLNRK